MLSVISNASTGIGGGYTIGTNQEFASEEDDWTANLRSAIDLSARRMQSLSGDDNSWQFALGLDIHKVFQDEDGDYGTLVFQPYLVKLVNVANPPFFFDDGDDVELTWRIANFNYTGFAHGKLNFRIGHFEVPFGLEQNIDTNGTLRQYTFADRGIKADWGVSLNGVLPEFEYEIALTRGSGNNYETRHDPYLFSARIGTPANRNFVAGLSALSGEVLHATGTNRHKRLGVDLAYYIKQWEWLMEVSAGETNNVDRANILAEASWRSPMEQLHVYTQFRQAFTKPAGSWEDGSRMTVGVKYDVDPNFSLSGELFHDLATIGAADQQTSLLLQIRKRL